MVVLTRSKARAEGADLISLSTETTSEKYETKQKNINCLYLFFSCAMLGSLTLWTGYCAPPSDYENCALRLKDLPVVDLTHAATRSLQWVDTMKWYPEPSSLSRVEHKIVWPDTEKHNYSGVNMLPPLYGIGGTDISIFSSYPLRVDNIPLGGT